MPSRLMATAAVALLAAVALSGCVVINGASTSQPKSMGPITLTINGCADGSSGCAIPSNTGSIYNFLEGSSEKFGAQVLLAVRLPDGSTPPNTIKGSPLEFTRATSFEVQLEALEPAPAGERWWGWVSNAFTYSRTSGQSFSASLEVTLPRPADGGPYPSPLHWRPVLGVRFAQSPYSSTRPVNCGPKPADLYKGFNESGGSGNTIVCIDSTDESATRGFLEAPLIDFGILGTKVTAAPGSTLTTTFLAKRSGGNDFATTFALAAKTAVPGGTVEIDRDSVPLGGDSVIPVQATITVPAGTPPGSYEVTLTGTAAGRPTRSGTTVVTVPRRAPKLTASLSRKRFRAGSGEGTAPVGTKLRIGLSDRAKVSIAVARLKGKRAKKLGVSRRKLPKGKSTIAIRGKIGKVKLSPGRYRLTLRATRQGVSSPKRVLSFTLVKG